MGTGIREIHFKVLYSRKVWRRESLANSLLQMFGEEKFGEWTDSVIK